VDLNDRLNGSERSESNDCRILSNGRARGTEFKETVNSSVSTRLLTQDFERIDDFLKEFEQRKKSLSFLLLCIRITYMYLHSVNLLYYSYF